MIEALLQVIFLVIDHDIDEQTAAISLLTCSTRSQLRATSQSLLASVLAILKTN